MLNGKVTNKISELQKNQFKTRANAFKFQYFFRYKSRSDDILLTAGFSPWIETRHTTSLQSPAGTILISIQSVVSARLGRSAYLLESVD